MAPWKRVKAEVFELTKGWESTFNENPTQAWKDVEEEFAAAGKNGLLDIPAAIELAYLGASWALLNPSRDIPGLLVSSSFDANQLPLSPSILVT